MTKLFFYSQRNSSLGFTAKVMKEQKGWRSLFTGLVAVGFVISAVGNY